MTLAVEHLPSSDPDAMTVAMVHGFTQNAACMGPFGEAVRTALRDVDTASSVVLIDAPGHGRSEHEGADLIDAGRLCVEAAGVAHYIGYSMGGRMLLHGALLFPEAFESLTLIGATAGIDDPVERAERTNADELLATRIETEGLEAFIDAWLDLPLFSGIPERAAGRAERLRNRPEGLVASLRQCGTGNQYPLWSRLGSLDLPVLVIAGRDDPKFTALGRRLVESMPNARFESIDGGHAVHTEHPTATARAVASFLREVRKARLRDGDAPPAGR